MKDRTERSDKTGQDKARQGKTRQGDNGCVGGSSPAHAERPRCNAKEKKKEIEHSNANHRENASREGGKSKADMLDTHSLDDVLLQEDISGNALQDHDALKVHY